MIALQRRHVQGRQHILQLARVIALIIVAVGDQGQLIKREAQRERGLAVRKGLTRFIDAGVSTGTRMGTVFFRDERKLLHVRAHRGRLFQLLIKPRGTGFRDRKINFVPVNLLGDMVDESLEHAIAGRGPTYPADEKSRREARDPQGSCP